MGTLGTVLPAGHLTALGDSSVICIITIETYLPYQERRRFPAAPRMVRSTLFNAQRDPPEAFIL